MNRTILAMISTVIMFSQCGQKNKIVLDTHFSNNIDSFKKLIKFPFEVTAIKWEIGRRDNGSGRGIPGPDDYILVAEVNCIPEDSSKIDSFFTLATDPSPPRVYLDSSFFRNWYSKSLNNAFYQSGEYIRPRMLPRRLNPLRISNLFVNQGWFVRPSRSLFFISLYSI